MWRIGLITLCFILPFQYQQCEFELVCTSPDYYDEWYNDKGDFQTADAVSVTAPDTIRGIDAVLGLNGSISGTVTDSRGVGISGLRVFVWDAKLAEPSWDWVSCADTDDNGRYTLMGIPTGLYKVYFDATDTDYQAEWYNDKTDFETADGVSVVAPNTTGSIDAVLTLKGSISGKVTDSQGVGIEKVSVVVLDTDEDVISRATTDTGGNYKAGGIPTGTYKVGFDGRDSGYVKEWYNDKATFESADVIPVTAPNTTENIDAVLALGGSVSGRVTNSQGVGINSTDVCVFDGNQIEISCATTDDTGNYTVKGIPTGRYKVHFAPPWIDRTGGGSAAECTSRSLGLQQAPTDGWSRSALCRPRSSRSSHGVSP